jgi:uncharacterized protein YhfF
VGRARRVGSGRVGWRCHDDGVEPLSDVDRVAARSFWDRYVDGSGDPTPFDAVVVECFGDHRELADTLTDLVVDGPKRATAGSVADYEAHDDPLPTFGDRWVMCDGSGWPRAVLIVTDVRIGPLSSVDEQFAWDEGEGDRTRSDWLRAHTQFFRRRYEQLGLDFHDDIEVVFERFAVAYAEPR